MLLSSVIVYVPAYATPTADYSILMGENIINEIKTAEGATNILLKDLSPVIEESHYWGWIGPQWWKFGWVSVIDYVPDEFTETASVLNGTSDLPLGTFELILVDASNETFGSVSLQVNANTAPAANSFTLPNLTEVEADTNTTIDVTLNVSDVDLGQTLSLVGATISDPAAGSVSTDGNLNVIYTQKADYAGSFTIDYTVQDDYFVPAGSNLASITIVVDNTNDAPVAGDISKSTAENTMVSIDPLSNWSDKDALDVAVFVSNTNPSNGVIVQNAGMLEYTPNPGFSGTDVFEYTIKDQSDAEATGQIRVAVSDDEPDNLQPVAPTLSITVSEGQQNVMVDTSSISDPDGDPVAVVAVSNSLNGNPALVTGNVYYSHGGSNNPTDSFTYTVSDGQLQTQGTVNVTVNGQNGQLIAYDDTMILSEDEIGSLNVVRNDLIEDGFDRIEITRQPEDGNAWVVGSQFIKYDSSPDFVGVDTIEYKVFDNDGDFDIAVLTIDVRNDDDNIRYIRSDNIYTLEGQTAFKNVLRNDRFTADIVNLDISISPSHGVATIDETGKVTYLANPTFDGHDGFWYRVTLETGEVGFGYVRVHIGEVDKIILADDIRTVEEDSTNNYLPVLDNDIITVGVRHFGIEDQAMHGTATVNNGRLYYTPDPNFTGIDTFRYYVRDNDGWRDVASVLVNVTPLPDVYDVGQLEFDIDKDETLVFNPFDELPPMTFGPVVAASFTDPAFGVITHESDGQITYNPGNQHRNVVVFDFELLNAAGDKVIGTVVVDVGLLSDEIAIYLFPFETTNPYNGDVFTDFFFQQGEDIDLIQHLEYGLVGTNYPANMVDEQVVELQMVPNKGFVAPGESAVDDGVILNVQSYGQILITYNAGDPQ
jgi:hypothetical protein